MSDLERAQLLTPDLRTGSSAEHYLTSIMRDFERVVEALIVP